MELNVNKVRGSVQRLLALLSSSPTSDAEKQLLEDFLRVKKYSAEHVENLLNFLSGKLLDENFTEPIAVSFEYCLLLILTNIVRCEENVDEENFLDFQRKCVALAKLMTLSVDARRYSTSYFRNKPAPFQQSTFSTGPKSKKLRNGTSALQALDSLTIVRCCFQLLSSDAAFFKDLWDWSLFVEDHMQTQKRCDLEQLYCNHIIAILTSMSSAQLNMLNRDIPAEVLLEFDSEQNTSLAMSDPLQESDDDDDAKENLITLNFNSDLVTNVEGVLLPVFNKDNYNFYAHTDGSHDKIVKVDSTKVNLRSIALGVASAKAICLSGSVGCGKTTLVEYLARKTGRVCPKLKEREQQCDQDNQTDAKTCNNNGVGSAKVSAGSKRKTDLDSQSLDESLDLSADLSSNGNGFLRIQLGDQTDSKMLLGQYRCTDVPGEFIWLPGVLTQAVMNGYWLLLEDLDAATQDTYTILSGLLENNFLSVPGFRDCIKVAPGFQLFVTVRTNKSSSNSARKSLFSLLEKYLYTINILPLSRNELCKVIATNYPKLATVANRIVDVFLTFSSGDHNSADNLRQQETGEKADSTEQFVALPFEEVSLTSVPNAGRLVSTRDLVKLCKRSDPVFSVTSTECAYFVFQNAVDVFCSYLPQGKEKTKFITSIGAKLGIIQSRCEFFATDYKPEVAVDSERIQVGRAKLFAKMEPHDAALTVAMDDNPVPVKRQKLSAANTLVQSSMPKKSVATFSFTRMATCVLERIAVCVAHAEPVLLVGETGVGKTSSVQYLAERTQHKLVVVNMNNQSDVSDLVGGFKPVDLAYVIAPLRSEFEQLFRQTFNQAKNEVFLTKFSICFNQGRFAIAIKTMLNVVGSVFDKVERHELRAQELALLPRWQALQGKLTKLHTQLAKAINISFAFIPGSLVNCIQNGDWVLLDEINLASAETLECLSTILEPDGSIVLLEKGDFTPVKRHPEFRIFACMNPNTDIGKKDLSVGIRNRFTEFFVDELTTDADLNLLVSDYLASTGIQKRSVSSIVKLYKKLKLLSRLELNDGLGNRPVFSLRTLCRSLRICAKNLCGSIERNLYESFCMSFLTQLDPISHAVVLQLIKDALLSNANAVLKQGIPKPGENYLNFEGYWIQQGPQPPQECANYILTESIKENLKDLARIISIGKLPILLQGPTSAGKTSLIEFVAKRSGNHCLRINNHEHTDLQEYIGTYAADVTGKLSFREGVLVQAMRNGYWIILDELNLASTDILEALNRVLDDNRELFIPETQTVVQAHPNFMLFATQNPPGLYGGRKTLSRAFKNRFIELHFSEIPRNELEVILERRCLIPASYAKKMVACMSELQKNRKTTSKNIFTLRDLFRWGNRYTYADQKLLQDQRYDWNQHLIEEGYLVLSAKVRTDIEIAIIEETLYKAFRKRVQLERLFDAQSEQESSPVTRDIILAIRAFKQRTDIVWTLNMTRMAVLTAKALQFNEPVLLVGPTGCGKTTVCQILASIRNVQLRILNCHMHTEGADFLGGLRPCRQSEEHGDGAAPTRKLFEWADGPLIHSMQEGSYFMADEISLAEDSVLERLNCILEPERTVLLAEKGGVAGDSDEIAKNFIVRAKDGFQFLATMNPGGDFGKKELSPALRNRFTEVWCLPSDSKDDLVQIASNCMLESLNVSMTREEAARIAGYLVEIVLYIRDHVNKFKFSIRDILAWAGYIATNKHLSFPEQAIFGLETIFLDALEMLPHESSEKVEALKADITQFAVQQAELLLNEKFSEAEVQLKRGSRVEVQAGIFGIRPFYIDVNAATANRASNESFQFEAPTTKKNLFRLLSALTLQKPILLEGPPGVGKTSIVESIATAIGYNIVRINLCEHTDLADLFGTDLPAEDNALGAAIEHDMDIASSVDSSANVGSFMWRDGPLLAALKADNTWILLDELNLAPQSVLEGLNAILDHRGEVYIPELNKTFVLSKQTRIFACQNPLKQGGGRKGLPQSFLNRFNKVYLRKLTTEDLLHVVNGKYAQYFEQLRLRFVAMTEGCPITADVNLFDLYKRLGKEEPASDEDHQLSTAAEISFDLSERLVKFSEILDRGIAAMEFGYKGGPYEINLRDILRWCDLLRNPGTGFTFKDSSVAGGHQLSLFRENFAGLLLTLYERMKLVYYQRMRSEQDKLFIRNAFAEVFSCDAEALNAVSEDVALYWTDDKIYLNDIVLRREAVEDAHSKRQLKSKDLSPLLLSSQREVLKNIIECVHMEKPVLLCGGTDSGKTKLIDTLCMLSGQVCNTDTIDDSVTGSFQQIDLNRHLEEIVENVECVLMSYIQEVVLNCSVIPKTVPELLRAWSKYQILTKTKPRANNTSAMSEELLTFRSRLQNLKNVVEMLLAHISAPKSSPPSCSATLIEQQRLISVLIKHVNSTKSLNTGGSFEWVDSKIVKSLKLGQYMSLEHINLCSSAVLDRLNPVFEPNGSLLISEKGVSANDTAEIVTKAPNFRAFLTIDPKNGELSRAMRNRCVELALAKSSYDEDDMRMIIYSHGIHDMRAINCLIKVHERVVRLTEINTYDISHLTHCAFLTSSYKRIGYSTQRAIYVSGMEVYVYSASMDLMGYGLAYYQNKLREIVLEETNAFYAGVPSAAGASVNGEPLRNLLLNCSDLNSVSLIKLQVAPLEIMLSSAGDIAQSLPLVLKAFESIQFHSAQPQELLRFYLYTLYESSSMDDVQLRYLYLQKVLSAYPELEKLSHRLFAVLQNYKEHFATRFGSQLPWNRKLFPRIRDYTDSAAAALCDKSYSLSCSLLLKLLLLEVPQCKTTKMHQFSALSYSQAVVNQSISDKLNNAFLKQLFEFMNSVSAVLSDVLQSGEVNMKDFAQLMTAYLWFNRLLTMAQEKLFIGKKLNTDLLDKLLLHFKWLEKYLLSHLVRMQPHFQQLHPEFSASLQKLTQYVASVKHPLNLLRKVYAKQMTQFQPFYNEQQLHLHSLTEEMDQLLGVVPFYGSYTPDNILRKFLAQNSDAAKKCRAIAKNYVHHKFDYKFPRSSLSHRHEGHIPAELKSTLQQFIAQMAELEKFAAEPAVDCEQYKLDVEAIKEQVNSQEELTETTAPNDIALGMLPLREYYLTKALVTVLFKHNATGNSELNTIYCEEVPSLSNSTWQLINVTQSSKFEHFQKVWTLLLDYIATIKSVEEFGELFAYLNGCYRNLCSYNRLITNGLYNQQLNNLAGRLNCTQISKSSEDIGCNYIYNGPNFVNALIALIFQNNGHLKPVPLKDLAVWRNSLTQMQELLWHNAVLMVPSCNSANSNLIAALGTAQRILHEVDFVGKLCEYAKNEHFTEYNACFDKLVSCLRVACAQGATLNDRVFANASLKFQRLQYQTAQVNTIVGAIELCLLTFTPLIDPVEKNRLKKAYIVEDIDCLANVQNAYDIMRVVMRYKNLGAEIYDAVGARLNAASEKRESFSKKVALRPETCLYSSLVQDITHFLKTNCEPQMLHSLVEKTQQAWSYLVPESKETIATESLENCTEVLHKIAVWIANSQRFVNHILKKYTDYYQDILQPLQCAVDQTRFGLEGLKTVLTQVKAAYSFHETTKVHVNVNATGKLHKIIANIVEFPTSQPLNIFDVNSSREILKNRCAIFSVLDKIPGSEHDYFHLVKSKLTELRNLITIAGRVNEATFRDFDFALNVCNQIWQEEEERRRKKQTEEESLYVSKTKCETEDEELLELQEIEELFPTNVEEDFGEFLLEPTLEKVMRLDKKKDLKAKVAQVLNPDDYAFLVRNFIAVSEQFTYVYYHNPGESVKQEQPPLEFVDTFKERVKVFAKIFAHYKSGINECLDDEVYSSFAFAVGLQQQLLSENLVKNQHNFYKDSNIPELVSCTDILYRIEARVDEQLALYPEHASLVDIKHVIERICRLSSTSPVVRFNTGFQILRQKMAQWNEVAHKHNHLREEEIEVATYVQKWTKLELQFWRNCLSQTCEKIETNAYKYWFFIYNLLQEYIHDHEVDTSFTDIKYTEKRFADGEILDAADVEQKAKLCASDIVRILRQFVEVSNYGDFHVRMQLLQAFELYLHNVVSTSANSLDDAKMHELIAGLRNLQIYFTQFAKEIDETKRSMRAPVEKKLKEFVKIESYNKDLSYFSMRNNVARVHRNLHKFLKEYEHQLQQKITPLFQPADATVKDYNFANDKGKDMRYDSKIKYNMVDVKWFLASDKLRTQYLPAPEDAATVEEAEEATQLLLPKVNKLFATSRNVVKGALTNAAFPKFIITLDVLLGEQLERCEHLRGLQVDRTKERPHQVAEAKQILQQKRKALTDLFKTLAQLGINYKTGLMEQSLRTEFEDYSLPPFCVKTMLGSFKDKRIHVNILQLNENLDKYYAKCVFKLKLLQNIMLAPLSELGPPNIERIKGFAIDFFLLVQQQRLLLANTTKGIYDLLSTLQNLKEIACSMSAEACVDETRFDFWKSSDEFFAIKSAICRIRYVFEQFSLLVQCVPERKHEENQVICGSTSAPQFEAFSKACKDVLQLSKSTLTSMSSANTEFMSVAKLRSFRVVFDQLVALVKQVRENFKTPEGEYLPFARPLSDLLAFTESIATQTESAPPSEAPAVNFENVDAEIENILHSILLVLQKLFKKYANAAKEPADEAKDEDTENPLEEHHLKRKVAGELAADWATLNMSTINGKLSNIMLSLKHSRISPEKVAYLRKLVTVLPILEQYHLVAEYYLFQQIAAHKVSAKMLSVMLTVFVEISTKGFCVPADLMQDEEGQSKQDQKEGEGFGLEDGTGEKDASDKIESEDQLDDAKRPEDRKDDSDKQDDCKEEKGIEMSDDFEGKMQDIEKPDDEEDDSGESEEEEDLNKEMGETEDGAEKLDDQIWGDDEEPEQEEEEEKELDEEENGKGSKDDEDSHNDLDKKNDAAKQDGQDEHDKEGLDATNEPTDTNEDNRKKQEKDIDDMKDPEMDEEQTNAIHNELEEPPEPEDMDLGEMNDVDDPDNGDEQQGDENPFDIDKMKDNMQTPEEDEQGDENEEKDGDKENENNEDDGSDDSGADEDDAEAKPAPEPDQVEQAEEEAQEENPEEADTQKRAEAEPECPETEEQAADKEETREEKPEEHEQSKDKSSKEDNVQSIPEKNDKGSADQVESEQSEKDVKQEQKLDEQETGEEKDGVGQADNEMDDSGHQGVAETKDTVSQEERKQERQTQEKRKQGRTNEDRSLGEAEQNKLKQLKTIDKLKEDNEQQSGNDEDKEDKDDAEEYQHVKDPQNSDKTTLDNATEEQAKKIQHQDEEKEQDDQPEGETNDELMESPEEESAQQEDEQLQEMNAEKFDQKSEKPSKTKNRDEQVETAEEKMDIEGEVVQTMNVPRNADTTAHCIKEILLDTNTQAQELSTAETLELRKMYQQQLTTAKNQLPQHEDCETWQTISNRMAQNARELCEQLRLILEPTKCTRLKGDYRTGRRINMKKIIPYIASQFRKDKIWLRRTKPAQRDYKITIAIDDSKSMHHNNSKVLTLEAISLVSQALTLLESGRLSIMSFGESPQVVLNHTEQFDGPKLVNALNFEQGKTKIAELLDFIRIANVEEGNLGADNGLFENLLLVLSDGRNIFSEGKAKVRNAIKLARLQRIFLVYVIIDNPENKNSILDIQSMEMLPDKRISIKSYLDDFPFPYYVIVRDLNQLPLVLSEAMRQWFELVNSEQ